MTVNTFAGMGGHQSARSQTDTWFTPPAIIEALGGADSFDLDPCSHIARPWATARHHYTVEDNGLILPWFGRVWGNFPYSNPLISQFMARMAEHGQGTALVFARTETDAFKRFVWGAASGVLFLHGRLNFHKSDGSLARNARGQLTNAGAPSVLIAYGDNDLDVLAEAPIDGHFVPLRAPKLVVMSAINQSWAEALADFFTRQSGPVSLGDLYRAFARHPKSLRSRNWQPKLRQMLQRGQYERVEKGVWQRVAA